MALQLGVSRPVVHEGLVDLAAKGLVTMKPRVGTFVNDYRKEGSLSIPNSIINYQQGSLDEDLWKACWPRDSWWRPRTPG
ncbi:MAG: GntR family transcriptional regulator [Desulfomicrobium escambiense]|nr:GntR family transcriptional regulator [Desulfomicrobium escambiense]